MKAVRRLAANEPVFKKFTEAKHPYFDRTIFGTYRDFLCFLAVLGFIDGERTPLGGNVPTFSLEGRLFEEHKQSYEIMLLIALSASKDSQILLDESEDLVVLIFEEYVNTGFKVIDRWLAACPDDHVGSQAILSAFKREGFLGKDDDFNDIQSLDEIQF